MQCDHVSVAFILLEETNVMPDPLPDIILEIELFPDDPEFRKRLRLRIPVEEVLCAAAFVLGVILAVA